MKPEEQQEQQPVSSLTSMADVRNMMDSVKDIHENMAQRVATASLYGSFVKSATTDKKDDEEDEELKDYSMKITDAELFAACEGRTARKGGRGLVDQTGKFKRVMQDYVRPVDEDDIVDTKKRKRTDSTEKSEKKQKKEDKKARKAEKEAKKAEKEAKKAAKAEKRAAREVKKATKEAKKAAKLEKKAAKKSSKKD